MPLSAWAYGVAFLSSLGLVLFFTPLALRLAKARELLDHPGAYKAQKSPVPYLGGLAIVAGFSAVVISAASIYRPAGGFRQLLVIFAIALTLSFVGLLDDLRGLHPLPRFALEVAAGAAMWFSGVQVLAFDSEMLNMTLTVLWIVGVTNAFNLLDNMDGLSAGIAAISSIFLFLIAVLNDQFLVAALSIALAGCALGFLKHNFHPARIYMGDAGSLFLGFLLAVLGVKLKTEAPQEIGFMVPILVLGVAIVDTALVTTTRLLHRRNPFSGGRDHISHRLVFVGLSVPTAVSLVYAAGVSLGWLAVVMSFVDRTAGFILMGLVVAVAVFLAVLLARVPVYSTSKRRRMMLQEVAPHEEPVESHSFAHAHETAI